jgi:hypothetical protein
MSLIGDFGNTEVVRPNNTTGNFCMAAMCDCPTGESLNRAALPLICIDGLSALSNTKRRERARRYVLSSS